MVLGLLFCNNRTRCGGTGGGKYRPLRRRQCICTLPDCYQCIGHTARRRARSVVQYTLLIFVFLIVFLWIGMEIQEYHVKRAVDTLEFYTTPKVCGITTNDSWRWNGEEENNNNTSSAMTTTATTNVNEYELLIHTFPTKEEAQDSPDTFVGHCGDCGHCSNPHDIGIYDTTKNSLFGTSVACAKQALLWGRQTTRPCLEERVGFSPACNDCWVDNIMCDIRNCLFICLWQGLFHQVEDGSDNQALNRCTLCDEKRCGPDFIQCAGANRRRSGIVSDIERDWDMELCQSVEATAVTLAEDVEDDEEGRTTAAPWWQDETLLRRWYHQQEEERDHQQEEEREADPGV